MDIVLFTYWRSVEALHYQITVSIFCLAIKYILTKVCTFLDIMLLHTGWHHPQWTWVWVNLGVGDGQGGLSCCGSWGRKELDTTDWMNWTESPSLLWQGSNSFKYLRLSFFQIPQIIRKLFDLDPFMKNKVNNLLFEIHLYFFPLTLISNACMLL